MKKQMLLILYSALNIFVFNGEVYSQVYGFIDDFELYIPGQQLACQNSVDWTTWDSIPCDPNQDPVISTEHRATGTKSVKIVVNNDLVKPVNTSILYSYYINFWIYIPSGKSGYFNTLAVFDGINSNWAMECFFHTGGWGSIYGGSPYPIYFNWVENDWQFVELKVDLFSDSAKFYFDGNLIHSWQWTMGANGGGSPLSIEANDFYGYESNNEMYIDNYVFMCIPLTLVPLNAPSNLNAEEIFESHQIQLTWEDTNPYEYASNVLRKDGPPSGQGNFISIGTVPANTTVYIDSTVSVDSTYTYAVFAYNELGFSDTSNHATILVAVPVELVSFTSNITNGNKVILSWATATETNNRGFAVQRSFPGGRFRNIGFVQGNGTTTENHAYSYTDRNLSVGSYSYRLMQIDYDGSFEYSNVVEVSVTAPEEFALEQNFPNPFNPSTTISWQLPEGSNVVLKIFDALGQEITTLVNNEFQDAGKHSILFTVNSSLPSGIYFYKLQAGSPKGQAFVETKKMILLR